MDAANPAAAEEAAQRMLDRFEGRALEADVRSAICDFLVEASLVDRDDLRLEGDRIDIQSEDLVIEVKRQIGRTRTIKPDAANIAQLNRYLAEAREAGKPERLGILTDGRHWVLRLPGIDEVQTTPPYAFTLTNAASWARLREWLFAESQAIEQTDRSPREQDIQNAFSAGPRFTASLEQLAELHQRHRDNPTVAVKRELWRRLLTAALGVVVDEDPDLDRLFVRHTYLSIVVGMAVQSAFGLDIRQRVATDARGLLDGSAFFQEVGVRGVIESDFFAWPAETGGEAWLAGLAARVARFNWPAAEYDFVRILYQSVVPAEDRRRLGEYYTPDWLAEAVVKEVVDDPLRQRVLDPACGSGTFLRAAIRRYVAAAEAEGLAPDRIVDRLRERVLGIDIHPVSVHLARATWVLAALDVLRKAGRVAQELTVPVYLGDSLQLRTGAENMLNKEQVPVLVDPPEHSPDETPRELRFPRALVEQGDWFDGVMLRAANAIEKGHSLRIALDESDIEPGPDRQTLEATLDQIRALHEEGRNHIWAYYIRNLVRPAWLASGDGKADVIVGNPPWLTYNKSDATLRSELRRLSQSHFYNIWVGGHYATHQDVAGLFFTRCADLYLKPDGVAAMVLPHSALQAGQYKRWRTGGWGLTEVDLAERPSWDLERIEPNDFFPVPSCVVFARKVARDAARRLGKTTSRWRGPAGGPFTHEAASLAGEDRERSPYYERARQGAILSPTLLFFVDVEPSDAALVPGIVRTTPKRSVYERPPWKNLDPPRLRNASIEEEHVWPVHLGKTVAPFALLEPLHAVLPLSMATEILEPLRSDSSEAINAVDPTLLGERMRGRWSEMNSLWNEHKDPKNTLDLLGQLDYMGKLSSQISRLPEVHVVYTASGRATAAVLDDPLPVVDSSLYWMEVDSPQEAHYLTSIINSDALWDAVQPLMPKGQFGARHVHRHPWRLPIPKYEAAESLHRALADAGAEAAREASARLDAMRKIGGGG